MTLDILLFDDYSHFTWIYFMKHRSELPKIYITMVKSQFAKVIKILRTNDAMKYKDSSLVHLLQQ